MTFQNQIQKLVSRISEGLVIPIVGSDLLILQENGVECELTKYLAKEIFSDNDNSSFNQSLELENINELNDIYYHLRRPSDIHQLVKDKIEEKLDYIRGNIKSDSYDKLTKISSFKVYFNASCSDFLGYYLKKNRGNCEEFNFYDKNNPAKPQDVEFPNTELVDYFTIKKPFVYNLFGIYNQIRSGFIITEDDYIEFVIRLQQFIGDLANLRSLVTPHGEDDRITYLLIGCNFPNWLFRFFIRAFTNEKLTRLKNKSIVVSDSLVEKDKNRTIFFNNYQINSISGMTSGKFVDYLFQELKEKHPDCISEDFNYQLIFFSYASEDMEKVRILNQQLIENGVDSWFDEKQIQYGDKIRIEIKEGIDRASVVVPIISENSLMGDNRRYYQLEWDYMISKEKREDLIILPLIIDNSKNDSIGVREEFRSKHIAQLNENGKMSNEFINQLKEIQINKRRN